MQVLISIARTNLPTADTIVKINDAMGDCRLFLTHLSKIRITLHQGQRSKRVGKKHRTLQQLYKHKSWEQSEFEQDVKFKIGIVTLKLQVHWPDRITADQRRDWATGLSAMMTSLRKQKCHEALIKDLVKLVGYDIVIICDDSTSMSAVIDEGLPTETTRWAELRDNVETLVNLCCALDPNGIDVLFLNGDGKQGVCSHNEVADLFDTEPIGGTPLGKALNSALGLKKKRPMIILIATDGEPGDKGVFERALANRPLDVFVTLLACTDAPGPVNYLRSLDENKKRYPRLDMIDDFVTESQRVLECCGPEVVYTRGDHFARMLLGPCFERWGKMNEPQVAKEIDWNLPAQLNPLEDMIL